LQFYFLRAYFTRLQVRLNNKKLLRLGKISSVAKHPFGSTLYEERRILILRKDNWTTYLTNKGSSVIPFKKNKKTMKVAVWDTYVTKADGTIMNFDIL